MNGNPVLGLVDDFSDFFFFFLYTRVKMQKPHMLNRKLTPKLHRQFVHGNAFTAIVKEIGTPEIESFQGTVLLPW